MRTIGIRDVVLGSGACAAATDAAATPTTMPAVDTIPSLAPNTPARSQFSFDDTEPRWGSAGWDGVDTTATIYIQNPSDEQT